MLAEADRAGHLRQRAGVDHRGAELGQPSLGEVGVVGVERLGHDDAEHGVAEELQPLVGGEPTVLVGEGPVRERALQELSAHVGVAEGLTEVGIVVGLTQRGRSRRHRRHRSIRQRTGRRLLRAPYCPQEGQARCGRCLAPHAGLAQVASAGTVAFHCERRWRVLLRDIFRFGTATVSLSSTDGGLAGLVVLVVLVVLVLRVLLVPRQALQGCPAWVGLLLVTVVRVVREPGAALDAQPGAVLPAQRLER